MGVSHSYLYKRIKLISGQSVNAFIRYLRLRKAAEFLISTNDTVAQVAYSVGFSDVKYFREQFVRLFKMKPTEYIKQYRKKMGDNLRIDEKQKIKSAIVTDFILSIEIVIIALSTVLQKPLSLQILTVSVVSILATVGVYGIVALIVRMDDAGYKLIKIAKGKKTISGLGNLLVKALPIIIKILAVVGTVALILVAGGIFVHNIEYFHHMLHGWPDMLKETVFGLVIGLVAIPFFNGAKKIMSLFKK